MLCSLAAYECLLGCKGDDGDDGSNMKVSDVNERRPHCSRVEENFPVLMRSVCWILLFSLDVVLIVACDRFSGGGRSNRKTSSSSWIVLLLKDALRLDDSEFSFVLPSKRERR